MFIPSPKCPQDIRYSVLDHSNPRATAILNKARAAASRRWRGMSNHRELTTLRQEMEDLNMDQLNRLSAMAMISGRFNTATGEGAVWATASEIVNRMASEILRTRSHFEAIAITVSETGEPARV